MLVRDGCGIVLSSSEFRAHERFDTPASAVRPVDQLLVPARALVGRLVKAAWVSRVVKDSRLSRVRPEVPHRGALAGRKTFGDLGPIPTGNAVVQRRPRLVRGKGVAGPGLLSG